jgi:hypothetical protein
MAKEGLSSVFMEFSDFDDGCVSFGRVRECSSIQENKRCAGRRKAGMGSGALRSRHVQLGRRRDIFLTSKKGGEVVVV